MLRLFLILFLAVVAILGKKYKVLSLSGAVAGFIIGLLVLFLGGEPAFYAGIFFFISSSILTKVGKKYKDALGFEKGGNRDAWQAIGVALVPLIFLIIYYFDQSSFWPIIGFTVSGATDNADTWATEIGSLSKNRPRLITNLKPVDTGRSGGITLLGLGASLLGSFSVALFILLWRQDWNLVWIVTFGGFLGSIFDSFLGATVQAQRYCSVCGKMVENKMHCGKATKFLRGISWMNNQAVNMLSGLIAALITIALVSV